MSGGRGRAVVIGGGVAGLAAAGRLLRDSWDVLVIEKEPEPGGRCRTASGEGFLFDTGAQYYHDSFDATLKAAIQAGLGENLRIPGEEKGIYSRGEVATFLPRSASPLSLLPWKALGPRGMVEMPAVALPLLRRYRSYNVRFPHWWGSGDTSTAEDFLSRRTSPAYRNCFAEPVGLYATGVELDRLSAAGFMVALRYTFSDRTGCFTGGMGMLPRALARHVEVVTSMEATGVVRERGRVTAVRAKPVGGGRARSYKADFVICAVPAPAVKAVVGELGTVAGRVVEATGYTPEIVVNVGLDRGPAGFAGLVLLPRSEGFRAAWLTTHRSKTIEYAPGERTLVTAVFSGREAERLMGESDADIVGITVEEAGRAIETGKAKVLASRVDRHAAGRPVVSPGHSERARSLWESGSGIENLSLAGDWTASPTIEGAVTSGFHAAGLATGG